MLEIKNLCISILDRYLVKNLSFNLNKGDKLAIIGEEGNGKSTLLKSILGICKYATITGNINLKNNTIGYLEQTMYESDLNKKVFDYLFFNDEDYFNKVNNLYKYLEELNINESILKSEIKNLSGGEKVKIGILKLILNEYDILFLDEPTNDLDIETLEWLEKFINNINKPIIYISHDETLLSNTANIILHLEQIKNKNECRNTLLKTDYNTYIENRLKRIEKQTQVSKSEKREFNKKQEKLKQIMQKVEYQQNIISRSDPHGAKLLKKKMHTLKYQEKKLNNTDLTELPNVEESIDFFFESVNIPRTKQILKLDINELKIQDKILSRNIKLDVIGNKHICIIGKNGIGKTTLIKIIYNTLKDREDIIVGYMPQNYDDVLENYDDVLDFITKDKKSEEITKIMTYLGNVKFIKEEMTGKINKLSSGTKAKLFLIKLVVDKCNVLILDEPTRNVSPLSNPVIRKILRNFKGTIISISHDRKYIEEVINDLYIMDENGLHKN